MDDPGTLFLFGVYGKRPTRETVDLLKSTGACGALLLARNIETATQTRAFTEELTQRVGRPLLFAVDHEGGWVLRFKSGVTAFPGNAALGRARDPRLSYAAGRQMAFELSRLGIRLNLAPVLDVVTQAYNPGIGIRSFGSDPALVGRLGASFIGGLQDHGVSACAKHFPGKGAATVDAHVALPTIRMSRARFEREHLAPFRAAVRAGVDCVMTSHVRFPALDSKPATFSARITRDLLRGQLGFEGVVISDDLCMGAVTQSRPIQTAALAALDAGHDMLLIAHDRRTQRESVDLLRQAAADEAIKMMIQKASERIENLVAKRTGRTPSEEPADGNALCEEIAQKALEVVRRGDLDLPLIQNGRPPLVLFPDFAEVSERFTFEGGPRGPERLVRELASRWGLARLRRVPVETRRLGNLAAEIRRAPRVLFFCFEAMRFPGQKAALELLKRLAPEKTAVCLIRNPWDRKLLSPRMTALDAKGYRLCQLRAALHFMLRSRVAHRRGA